MSYHMHHHRDEVWTVVSGNGVVTIDDRKMDIKVGDVVTVKAGYKHMVEAVTNLDIVEVQIGKEISVDDKEKYDLE